MKATRFYFSCTRILSDAIFLHQFLDKWKEPWVKERGGRLRIPCFGCWNWDNAVIKMSQLKFIFVKLKCDLVFVFVSNQSGGNENSYQSSFNFQYPSFGFSKFCICVVFPPWSKHMVLHNSTCFVVTFFFFKTYYKWIPVRSHCWH